jgi:hypothetical protein
MGEIQDVAMKLIAPVLAVRFGLGLRVVRIG